MIVTRFKYPLETRLVPKLDLMVERCTSTRSKKDTVLLVEGSEGEGKTTYSVAIAYYVSEKTGRPFGADNVFFDINKMMDFLQNSENQIAIWDEPALQALSTDSRSTIVQNLTRLLMTARKKRHFIIINLTKFYKFNEYIIVDRPVAMIHVYSKNNIESGRFTYIKKRNLEMLYRDWRFSKKRNYKKYSSRGIRGTFPDVLSPDYKNNVLSEFDLATYEKRKDEGIASIGKDSGKERITKTHEKLIKLQYAVATSKSVDRKEITEKLGISNAAITLWKDHKRNYPHILEIKD